MPTGHGGGGGNGNGGIGGGAGSVRERTLKSLDLGRSRFMEDFQPENSRRERRKRRLDGPTPYNPSSKALYDDKVGSLGCFSNCGSKLGERNYTEQGTFWRSRSLDDLNRLILQEDHHLNYHLNHHHLLNQHSQYQHTPNVEGILNQPMFSSTPCDMENVLQQISRLEM